MRADIFASHNSPSSCALDERSGELSTQLGSVIGRPKLSSDLTAGPLQPEPVLRTHESIYKLAGWAVAGQVGQMEKQPKLFWGLSHIKMEKD